MSLKGELSIKYHYNYFTPKSNIQEITRHISLKSSYHSAFLINLTFRFESSSFLGAFSLFRLKEIHPPVNTIWDIIYFHNELKAFDGGVIYLSKPLWYFLYIIPAVLAQVVFNHNRREETYIHLQEEISRNWYECSVYFWFYLCF